MGNTYKIFARQESWIEGEAIEQLKALSRFSDIDAVFGMPDLHPGKGCPIGAVSLSKEKVFPVLIGTDIGCGIGLWNTELLERKIKRDTWASKLNMENPLDHFEEIARAEKLPHSSFNRALGTIGGGNHFAELQRVVDIYDAETFHALGLDKKRLVLCVHSGSRGLGQHILDNFLRKHACSSVAGESAAAQDYLYHHDIAVRWAHINRRTIAERFLSALGSSATPIIDECHNMLSREVYKHEPYWFHRKGACSTRNGFAVVPGSRGSYSYLLQATSNQEDNAYTIAHGAGRKWNRSNSKARLKNRYSVKELTQTKLGSRVICEDRNLLYEEAPQAYKNIEQVVQDLVEFNLVRPIARMLPIVTYKSRQQ